MKFSFKKVVFTSVVCAAAVVLAAGCRRADVRDFAVHVPQATQADFPALIGALKRYGGVQKDSLAFDAARRTLTLKYDSMQIAQKNIEMAIAAAGFTANGVTPESIGAKAR
ncbi:MAG: hypothetical protein PUJ80_03710 [Verrucomicrobiota bacterium]|nr:hypothetical protein [Verrucomicrobiota bacterium]